MFFNNSLYESIREQQSRWPTLKGQDLREKRLVLQLAWFSSLNLCVLVKVGSGGAEEARNQAENVNLRVFDHFIGLEEWKQWYSLLILPKVICLLSFMGQEVISQTKSDSKVVRKLSRNGDKIGTQRSSKRRRYGKQLWKLVNTHNML